jgi:mycofactocin system creatininase family protein
VRLADATWPDVDEPGLLLAIPVGACEQHGPHLPLDTDTCIATALAEELASRRADVMVAPAIAYGSSGEHAGFAGTLSIGQAAIELVLVELVRSAERWRGVVLVHGHGGNADPVARAVATLEHERRRVLSWWPRMDEGDLHAGRSETAMMLALRPTSVQLDRAEPGVTGSARELLAALRAGGVGAVSPNGVLGDPTGATAPEGRRLLAKLGSDLADAVGRWLLHPSARP